MLVERSYLFIKEGLEAEFHSAMTAKGLPLLEALDGAGVVTLGRGVENPDKFILLIEWDTMDAHTAFRDHPSHHEFRDLLGPYVRDGAMEHFNMD